MLVWFTLAICLTVPGQTLGVAVFIDHFIEGLDLSRSAVSTAYLVGTIVGAVALLPIGRWVDRVGVSRAMLWIGIAFGGVLVATSAVRGIVTLALAFVGIRMLGQGALSLIGQTGIALWFDRRRGLAIGISMTLSAGLMALAPLALTSLIGEVGWRWAWVVLGVVIWATVLPIARFAIVDRPSDIGQLPDGETPSSVTERAAGESTAAREALRTPAFWAVAAVSALSACLVTGLIFHQFSILGARGLTRTEVAVVFLPQLVGVLVAGFLFGWLADRVSSRVLLPTTAATLAAGLALATVARPGLLAAVYGFTIGVHSGQVRAIVSALYPRWFGTAHIGAIRGIATSILVGASAIGPLLISISHEQFDSYRPILLSSAAVTAAVGLLAGAVTPPAPRFREVTIGASTIDA